MGEKLVNQEAVNEHSEAFNEISGELIKFHDVTVDLNTTISASFNSLKAIGSSQEIVKLLSSDLKNESKNIKSIGAAFKSYDSAVKTLVENI